MNKASAFFLWNTISLFLAILTSPTPALGESFFKQDNSDSSSKSAWEISLQEWDNSGSFDYFLHYPNSSQIISKVHLPQNQNITVLNIKYTLPADKGFLKFQYGKSGTGIKGRGSDSDWTIKNSSTVTDYGELDSYGNQQQLSIDYGKILIKNNIHTISILGGWGRQETTNELKNVIYYLVDGVSYTGLSQYDNGSSLDGKFSGLHLKVNTNTLIGSKFTLNSELTIAYLSTKAYGYWANHTPAWNWSVSGDTIGYGANIGLKYAFYPKIISELKYYYGYSESTGCKEIINGSLISQLADLRLEQKGFLISLNFLF